MGNTSQSAAEPAQTAHINSQTDADLVCCVRNQKIMIAERRHGMQEFELCKQAVLISGNQESVTETSAYVLWIRKCKTVKQYGIGLLRANDIRCAQRATPAHVHSSEWRINAAAGRSTPS